MKPLTNRMLKITGDSNTVSMTVRVPKEVADYIDSHLTEQIKNRSEFLQHWAQVGVRVSMDEELTEALDWALGERDPAGRELIAPVLEHEPNNPPLAVAGTGGGANEQLGTTPSDPITEAIEWARELNPAEAVAGLEEQRVNFQVAMGGEPVTLSNVDPGLAEVYDDILGKLRDRIR